MRGNHQRRGGVFFRPAGKLIFERDEGIALNEIKNKKKV